MKNSNYRHTLISALSLLLALLLVFMTCGAALAEETAESDSGEAAVVSDEAAGETEDAESDSDEAAVTSDEAAGETVDTAGDSEAGESDSEEGESESAETEGAGLDAAAVVEEVKGASAGAAQEDGVVLDAEKQKINLEGVANARQLGGLVTEDGRKVKENVLLRSGELTAATEEDLKILSEEYHVTTVVDLRNISEINETPDPEIEGAENIHIALRDESMAAALQGMMGGQKETMEDFINRMRSGWNPLNEDIYVNLIETDVCMAGIREFIDLLLAQEDGTAILWHCSGGKDRTAVMAVAVLTLLGVDKDTILAEFELTNELIADQIESKVEEAKEYTDDENELYLIGGTASAIRLFMMKAYDYAEEQSGSMLEFIKQRCQVTDEEIELLKAKYLE